jgi:hypothetical protein
MSQPMHVYKTIEETNKTKMQARQGRQFGTQVRRPNLHASHNDENTIEKSCQLIKEYKLIEVMNKQDKFAKDRKPRTGFKCQVRDLLAVLEAVFPDCFN